jgi:hypothetical protein
LTAGKAEAALNSQLLTSTTGEPLNSSEPGKPNDDPCCDTNLIVSAAKLDVCRHERLAFTDPPRKAPEPPPVSKRAAAVLKAMAHWALAHF